MTWHRIVAGLLAVLVMTTLYAEEEPLPPLPPQERPLLIEVQPVRQESEAEVVLDRDGVVADFGAMMRIRSRVRALLEAGQVPEVSRPETPLPEEREPLEEAVDPDGFIEERVATRIGDNDLKLALWRGGHQLVTARIDSLRVEVVYRELMSLMERSIDDRQVRGAQRLVSLHVHELPWREALTRLLGQVGMAWEEDEEDRIVIFDIEARQLGVQALRERAARALQHAARDDSDPHSAEALYRIAAHQHALARREESGSRYWLALDRYLDVIERFDHNNETFVPARPWVRRAVRGYGSALLELGQYGDARGVFVRYISQADDDDPHLPQVYYAAAEASRRVFEASQAAGRVDNAARLQASDLLEVLLQRFGRDPRHDQIITRARLSIGRLLFARGDYEAAREHLLAHVQDSEGVGDQIRFMIAESAYRQAQQEFRNDRHTGADRLLHMALDIYQELFDRVVDGQADPLADVEIYQNAAFRIGQVHMRWSQPDYVKALFAFLRARRRYREAGMDADLVIAIARCYQELRTRGPLIDELYNLLRSDRLRDGRSAEVQISQLLGDIKGDLAGYDSAVENTVRFYIAQAQFAAAQQEPRRRGELLREAIREYDLVVQSQDGHLRTAARLGLGRAALMAGDTDRGEQALRDIIRAHDGDMNRDVLLAAQLLGDHYQRQGRFAEAIRAYQARLDEDQE